ncbi:MAG: polysaccharide biosynthesis C-terminal domain-containing protein [Clostridia bacterium]|nr:polysaccharide biosynthesis C-terminal domain-containing protein [Clostridia bacterium]
MAKKVIDMTVGSPFKNIILFAIPIALGFMLQNLYSLGDVLIVSHSLNANAATGVNLTGSITFLVLGFSAGLSSGFGIVLSQYVGAKDAVNMRKSVATTICLSVIISITVAVIATVLSSWMLKLLDTPDEFINYSDIYLKAIFIGLPCTMMYNVSSEILRAMGDSRTPLITLILCAIINIGLNSLLFVAPSFTCAWAGWATIISQAVSAAVGFIVIFKKFPELKLSKDDFKFAPRFVGKHLLMGIPMSIQFVITASGCMVQQQAINGLPAPAPMAQANGSKIDNLFGMFLNGCGVAMATYCGQNYGAKKYDRIKKGFIAGFGAGAIFTVISMCCNTFLAVPLSKILLPAYRMEGLPAGVTPDNVYDMIFTYNGTQSCFYYFLYLIFMSRQALQGIGKSTIALFGGVVEFFVRLIASPLLANNFGFMGIVFSNPLAWIVGGLFLTIAFIICFVRLCKKANAKEFSSL